MNINEFCDWLNKELDQICIMPGKCVAFEAPISCVEVTTPFLDTHNDAIQLYVAQRRYIIGGEPVYRSDFVDPFIKANNETNRFVIFDDGFFSSNYPETDMGYYIEDILLTEKGVLEYEVPFYYVLPCKILLIACKMAKIARSIDTRFPMKFESKGKE